MNWLTLNKYMAKAREQIGKEQKQQTKNEVKRDAQYEKRQAKIDANYAKRHPDAAKQDQEFEDSIRESEFDRAFPDRCYRILNDSNLAPYDVGVDRYQTPIEKVKQVAEILRACDLHGLPITPHRAEMIKCIFSNEYSHEQQDTIADVLEAVYSQGGHEVYWQAYDKDIVSPNHTAEEMSDAAHIVRNTRATDIEDIGADDKVKALFAVNELRKLDKLFTPAQMDCIDRAIEEGFSYDQLRLYANPDLSPAQMEEIISAIKDNIPNEKIELFAKPEFDEGQMNEIRSGYRATAIISPDRMDEVDKYVNSKFNIFQLNVIMDEISNGYMDPNDIAVVANPKIDADTMEAMIDCFHAGMDRYEIMEMVKEKSNPEQMKQKSNDFKIEKRIASLKKQKTKCENIRTGYLMDKNSDPEHWNSACQEKLDSIEDQIKNIDRSLRECAEELSYKRPGITNSSIRNATQINGAKAGRINKEYEKPDRAVTKDKGIAV